MRTFPTARNLFSFKTLLMSYRPKPRCRRWARMSSSIVATTNCLNKIVVFMGATGCGKSKVSVDLATRYFPCSEIINSDKIQVYRGLDITTNKIPILQRRNVPHHLLGEFGSSESHPEFTPSDFRSSASYIISKIFSRNKVPFIVGGSNSFVYALLAEKFDPQVDVFAHELGNSVFCNEIRYKCCFIWVDVSSEVLNQYLGKRVDDMLESGMYEELADYFGDPQSDSVGLRKAIGVAEFERYFNRDDNEVDRYEEIVKEIKDNTCKLAKRQVEKILRLKNDAGWKLKRVNATAAVRAEIAGEGANRVAEIWEKQVVEPSVNIVKRFLVDDALSS